MQMCGFILTGEKELLETFVDKIIQFFESWVFEGSEEYPTEVLLCLRAVFLDLFPVPHYVLALPAALAISCSGVLLGKDLCSAALCPSYTYRSYGYSTATRFFVFVPSHPVSDQGSPRRRQEVSICGTPAALVPVF